MQAANRCGYVASVTVALPQRPSTDLLTAMLISTAKFDNCSPVIMVLSSRLPRASPETSLRRSGMRRPARAARNRVPGGARQNRPSTTTSGTRECANARPKGTAPLCNARRFRQGGSGANNRRGGAPRGERPDRKGREAPRKRLRACVTGPLNGCLASTQSTFRRSASLTLCEGPKQTSEDKCLARTMKLARRTTDYSAKPGSSRSARRQW
jgi:hypothetical protein